MTNYRKIKEPLYVAGAVKCASGLTVDSGGATITAGTLTVTAGGLDLPVANGTTAADLPAYGTSCIGATAAKTYDLASPTVGMQKVIICSVATPSSNYKQIVRASTGGTIAFDGTNHLLTFTSSGTNYPNVTLVGLSSATWGVLSVRGTITLTTA